MLRQIQDICNLSFLFLTFCLTRGIVFLKGNDINGSILYFSKQLLHMPLVNDNLEVCHYHEKQSDVRISLPNIVMFVTGMVDLYR